jgi:hypothetical protein
VAVGCPVTSDTNWGKFNQERGGTCEARVGLDDQHDRYLVIDTRAFLSGASFKDLGKRESVITETVELRDAIVTVFERRWASAQVIAID